MKRFDGQSGFTLNEILIVVAIIGILVSVLIGAGRRLKTQADEKLCRSTIEVLVGAIEQYYDNRQAYPDPAANLYDQLNSVVNSRRLIEQIQASQISGALFIDPWGNPIDYSYIVGQSFPVITSGGPDGDLLTAADNLSSK